MFNDIHKPERGGEEKGKEAEKHCLYKLQTKIPAKRIKNFLPDSYNSVKKRTSNRFRCTGITARMQLAPNF